MKKIIFFILMFLFSMPCLAEDDGFMEEYINIDLEQSQVQKEELNRKLFLLQKIKIQLQQIILNLREILPKQAIDTC